MQRALNLALFTFSLVFTGCILHNPYLNKNSPAQQEEINPSPGIPEQTFDEADLNSDGKLDKKEAQLANKIEESQNSKWPLHLTAFIAIISAVLAVCVVCMVIAGFRGKPKEEDEEKDTTNTGFGNFFGLLKEGEKEGEDDPVEEDFMGTHSDGSDGPTEEKTEDKE